VDPGFDVDTSLPSDDRPAIVTCERLRQASQLVGRLEELIAGEAIDNLDAEEIEELKALSRTLPREAKHLRTELACSAGLYVAAEQQGRPPVKQSRLSEDVRATMAGAIYRMQRQQSEADRRRQTRRRSTIGLAGWALAALTSTAAIVASLELQQLAGNTVDIGPLISDGPIAELAVWTNENDEYEVGSPSYRIAHEAEAARVFLAATNNEVQGGAHLIWSDKRQGGLVQTLGLPPNEPTTEQYQVWIIDSTRPEGADRIPAGTFNVFEDATRERLLKTLLIRPSLPIGKASAFAITREPAGGSITSDWTDGRLLLFATAGEAADARFTD
jgi:anti-sigma-K factor RskA